MARYLGYTLTYHTSSTTKYGKNFVALNKEKLSRILDPALSREGRIKTVMEMTGVGAIDSLDIVDHLETIKEV